MSADHAVRLILGPKGKRENRPDGDRSRITVHTDNPQPGPGASEALVLVCISFVTLFEKRNYDRIVWPCHLSRQPRMPLKKDVKIMNSYAILPPLRAYD